MKKNKKLKETDAYTRTQSNKIRYLYTHTIYQFIILTPRFSLSYFNISHLRVIYKHQIYKH